MMQAAATAVRAMEEGRGGDPSSSSSAAAAAAAAGVAIGYPLLEPQQGARLRRRRISSFMKYFSRGLAIGMEIGFIVFGTIAHLPVWLRIFLIISLSILPFTVFSGTFQEDL